MKKAVVLLVAVLLLGCATPSPPAAQDFSSPAPAGPGRAPLAFIESALPPADGGLAAEGGVTRWFALPDLVTRASALSAGVGGARIAAGVSQTGDPELGWSTAGMALGSASPSGGAGLSAAVRRDRAPIVASPLGRGIGMQVGGGAWLKASRRVRVWASAPQLWTRGLAPPAARGLEIGGVLEGGGMCAWLARRAEPRTGAASRSAGLGFSAGAWTAWIAARDHPLRGGLGISGGYRAVRLAASVESHPVLGETTMLSAGFDAARIAR